MQRFWLAAGLICLPLLVGCEGCRSQPELPDEESKQQKPVPDFTSESSRAFPTDSLTVMGGIKPGHWVTCSQSIKSNKIDTRGQLRGEFSSGTLSTNRSPSQWASDHTLPTLRPVVLPKGQKRRFDFRLLAPIPLSANQSSLTLRTSPHDFRPIPSFGYRQVSDHVGRGVFLCHPLDASAAVRQVPSCQLGSSGPRRT